MDEKALKQHLLYRLRLIDSRYVGDSQEESKQLDGGVMIRRKGHDHDRHQTASFEPQSWSRVTTRATRADRARATFTRCGCCRGATTSMRRQRSCRSRRAGCAFSSSATTRAAPSQLGDQRVNNGTEPTILTPDALGKLKERLKTPPDDGGVWTGPKIARWLAQYHGLKSVHDQRGWDALIAIGYSIQQPRPRHPQSGNASRIVPGSKKAPARRRGRATQASATPRSRSGRRTSIASA